MSPFFRSFFAFLVYYTQCVTKFKWDKSYKLNIMIPLNWERTHNHNANNQTLTHCATIFSTKNKYCNIIKYYNIILLNSITHLKKQSDHKHAYLSSNWFSSIDNVLVRSTTKQIGSIDPGRSEVNVDIVWASLCLKLARLCQANEAVGRNLRRSIVILDTMLFTNLYSLIQ